MKYVQEVSDPQLDFNYNYNAMSFVSLDTTLQSYPLRNVTASRTDRNSVLSSNFASPNYASYAIANSPLKPQGYTNNYLDSGVGASSVSFAECLMNVPTSNATKDIECVFGLNNTYFMAQALEGATIPTARKVVGANDAINVPSMMIGARCLASKNGTALANQEIQVYANEYLFSNNFQSYYLSEANRNLFNSGENILLTTIKPEDYNLSFLERGLKLKFIVYAEEGFVEEELNNTAIIAPPRYFVRFTINTPYQDIETVVYDSKTHGLSINQNVVNTGYLWQQLKSYDGTKPDTGQALSGGMIPMFFWNNCEADDFNVFNCRAQNIAQLSFFNSGTPTVDWTMYLGTEGYRMEVPFEFKDAAGATQKNPNAGALENILRVTTQNTNTQGIERVSTFFNPNILPYNNALGGITSLGSDLTRYNIELNLPIRAYNNTENEQNDIGQTRTIVYNTDPVIEETGNFSAGLVNKNILPPDIKFLSLNNTESLKLNELIVEIRNSKTNNIANEISDAAIELIFKSE